MKSKFFFLLFLVSIFSALTFAQSVVVTSKKVIYKRPKPISDYKKSFTVNYPKINGVSPALARKIESVASYEKEFDFKIREELSEIQWLEEAGYDVDYNKNGILGLTLFIEGSGAYPSSSIRAVNINTKTGTKITPQDVFINLNGLAAMIKKAQQEEIKNSSAEIKKDDPEEDTDALFRDADYTVKNLNQFTVSDKGITFWYDYGFPHVIQALQPEGRYFFSWAQLKPYIKPGGLLSKFVR